VAYLVVLANRAPKVTAAAQRHGGIDMPEQLDWRFCVKCSAMFFDGSPHKGTCPGGGGHNAEGLIFRLPHDTAAPGQDQWRFCSKCHAMFFDGSANKGACPSGGGHQAQGVMFKLPHDVPPSATAQDQWRFCSKCHAMFFDGSANKGLCPRGAGHQAQGFMFVLPHTGASRPATLHMWTDSLRCHSETPGVGIDESDEPFVLVAVIDLERKNALGIPPTEVLLYGPLGNVDDQENHSFPFRPFWIRPFTPSSAIFLTAILEHDEVNPDLTRSAAAGAVQAVATATAGAPRERIVSEALSAFSGAVEPVSAPAVVNRLIGPPRELHFSPAHIAEATAGATAREILRFSGFGDYSVHYLARRN
jgi:hypothetical protein